ncbi:MAG: filamentous hemagglutinin N-terminal domain-containing protein [Gammaproteobacteria bacterium]|nr:filamentous hemagglutinin N-terminal domain-containing protein [Gammaproteobacteria bacterium]MCP5196860.1 filamentous hemagglutinin N-terminal domain-containing protein [Gammaproteobacteria bacterium]
MLHYRKNLAVASFGIVLASTVQGQVTLDGTFGPSGSLSGPNYAITADLGQQVGSNLFHSFGVFSIQTGESATFSGPSSVSNIIGRVTGGQVSFIDGALRSTIPSANLYLLNPAGVLFGEHASLDVPGSVHMSTADYLKLGDGGRFDARTPGNSVLTVAPVEAFGFLGDTPGRIAINGSFLQVSEGQTLSLIGGNISLNNATVYAPAGRIDVAAVGSAGEVAPTETDVVMQGFGKLGRLTIERDPAAKRVTIDMGEPFGSVPLGDLDTSGEGGGAIFIRGGEWVSQGGWVFADTYGNQHGRNLDFSVQGDMTLENGAIIGASTFDNGNAGKLTLRVARLKLIGGSQINADTRSGLGQGGNLVIEASGLVFIAGQDANRVPSALTTNTFAPGSSQGGNIRITTPILTLENSGEIVSATTGDGKAGNIRLDVGRLFLINGGQVSTNTGLRLADGSLAGGHGQGGNLVVIATESVSITGRDAENFRSGLFASSRAPADGQAGVIKIQTPVLTLADGGAIRGITSGDGAGGNIDLNVRQLNLTGGGQVSTNTQGGQGQGGHIDINAAESIFIAGRDTEGNASGLLAGSRNLASGKAGSITVQKAPLLMIADGGVIRSSTKGAGDAGNIDLTVDYLILTSGGQIDIGTQRGTGIGGNLMINANESILITGWDAEGNPSNLSASSQHTSADSKAGMITIQTPLLMIADGGVIQSNTSGDGAGGNIKLTVEGQFILTGGGQVNASTQGGSGRSGSITVIADESVLIAGQDTEGNVSRLLANSHASASGNAGSITVKTPLLVIADSGAIRSSTKGDGNAGDINLEVGRLSLTGGGRVNTNTGPLFPDKPGGLGQGGRINILATESILIAGPDSEGNVSGLFANSRDPAKGKAGNITLSTPEMTIADGGGIFTRSDFVGGGNIIVSADHIKLLNGSQISSSVAGDERSKGGNVTINSTNIVALAGSAITAQANQGLGGNIKVNAEVFLHDAPSVDQVLNASSQVIGNDGTVQLNAPTTDISGSLVALDPAYLDAAGQLSPRCGTGDLETRSRFIIQGRGALPLDPNDTAPAPTSRCGSERLELASTAGERAPGNVQPPASVTEPSAPSAFGFSNR